MTELAEMRTTFYVTSFLILGVIWLGLNGSDIPKNDETRFAIMNVIFVLWIILALATRRKK